MKELKIELGKFLISRGVSSTEFGDLETLCKTVVKEKQPFERLEVTKETLLKMFKVSVGKLYIQLLADFRTVWKNQLKNKHSGVCCLLKVQNSRAPLCVFQYSLP